MAEEIIDALWIEKSKVDYYNNFESSVKAQFGDVEIIKNGSFNEIEGDVYIINGAPITEEQKTSGKVTIPVGALILEYTITTPGSTNLFYEKVSPAGNTNTISVFPQGSTGELVKINSDGTKTVIESALNLYHETTSKSDTCFTYNFTEAGKYELRISEWNGNTNDPGTHNPDDLGMAVYAQMFRGSKITTLSAVKSFAFPSNVASFYSMFNSCKATGHFPDVISNTATRPTDMFDSSLFSSIGNIIMPNAWKTQTSGAAGSDVAQSAYQMFVACNNLKSIGDINLGEYCINTERMFAGDSNLEKIGVIKCLKNVTNINLMFQGCSKLASIKFAELPIANVILDLSACPIDSESLDYMAENVNNGAATISFSNITKNNSNFNTVKVILENKGYTIQ